MNAQEKLTAQKNDLHVQQANEIVDRLLRQAQDRLSSARLAADFESSDSYDNPCPNLEKPAVCGLSYCLDCHYIRTGNRVGALTVNWFFMYPLRSIFFLKKTACHDVGTCRAAKDSCFERHAFPNFDPNRLKGVAKIVYVKLTEHGFTITLEKAHNGFKFVLSW